MFCMSYDILLSNILVKKFMFQVQVHGIMENPFFFTVVSKLASRIVLFYWYWYRLLNFWYRDTPSAEVYSGLLKRQNIEVGRTFYNG